MPKDLQWWTNTTKTLITNPGPSAKRLVYNSERFMTDTLNPLGYCRYPYRIFFLAGLALGGTTWMKNLLGRIPGVYTRPTPMPDDVKYRQDICDSAFSKTPKIGNTLFKTHLNPSDENYECLMRNGVERIVVTYRDLRDVTLSHYHRLIQFPKPKDAFDYKDYQAMGKEEALDDLIEDTAKHAIPWVKGWLQRAKQHPEQFHVTKFEELKADTKEAFKKVLDFYKVDLSESKIESIIEAAKGRGNVKDNIKASKVLPWGVSSNFRSGKVGGWREEFSEAHIQKCKDLFGEALIEWGYEKDLNWHESVRTADYNANPV